MRFEDSIQALRQKMEEPLTSVDYEAGMDNDQVVYAKTFVDASEQIEAVIRAARWTCEVFPTDTLLNALVALDALTPEEREP